MTNPSGNPMDAVAGLMLERQRLEGWLAALDAKRDVTPSHVFERVRADYQARLDQIVRDLSGRTTELQEMISVLTTRLARLQSEETARRDERYEAELRAAVGEFTPEQWQALVQRSDAELARLGAERTSTSAELARLQQILSMAGGRPRPDVGAAPSAPAPSPLPSSVASAAPSAAPVAPPAPAGTNGGTGDVHRVSHFDELAFLQSVVDARAGASAAPATGESPAPAAPRAPTGSAPAVSSSGTSEPGTTPGGAPPAGPTPSGGGSPPAGNNGAVPATAGTDGPRGGEESKPSVSDTGAVPAFLKDVPTEQARTLRCADCGQMNYPTEWYCERCGAELAAM